MTEAAPTPNLDPTNRRATVYFSRKVNMAERGGNQYESAEFGIYLQTDLIPDGASAEDITVLLTDAATQAKAIVFEQLDISFDYTNGVLREQLTQTLKAEPVAAPRARQSAAPRQGRPAASGTSALSTAELWDLILDEAEAGNITSVYDNRSTKKGNQPDFKEKGRSGNERGLWVDGKGTPDHVKEYFLGGEPF